MLPMSVYVKTYLRMMFNKVAKKRVRGANWTAAEQAKLSAFCCEHVEVLDAELSGAGRKYGNITADQQQALWRQITDAING